MKFKPASPAQCMIRSETVGFGLGFFASVIRRIKVERGAVSEHLILKPRAALRISPVLIFAKSIGVTFRRVKLFASMLLNTVNDLIIFSNNLKIFLVAHLQIWQCVYCSWRTKVCSSPVTYGVILCALLLKF